MKKKIINGIMMVALVAATSTSFVSCKDTNEDVRVEMQTEYKTLLERLEALDSKYGNLDGRVGKLETKVKNMAGDIATLQKEVDDLEKWVVEAFNNLITSVEFAGTYNNMTGRISAPGLEPMMLINNYGTAAEEGKFPSVKDKNGNQISWAAGDEIGTGKDMKLDITEDGDINVKLNGGFAGYMYTTINSYQNIKTNMQNSDLDEKSIYNFALVNTAGEEVPGLMIANVEKDGAATDDVLEFGWTRAAENNIYKLAVAYVGDDASSYVPKKIELSKFKDDLKAIWAARNTTTGTSKQALGHLAADLYYNLATKEYNLPKYALKISWKDNLTKAESLDVDAYSIVGNDTNGYGGDNGDVIQVDETKKEATYASHFMTTKPELLFATFEPLSFNAGPRMAEKVGQYVGSANKTIEKSEALWNKIFNKIKAQIPNFDPNTIKDIKAKEWDGTVGDKDKGTLYTDGANWWLEEGGNGGFQAGTDMNMTNIISPLNTDLGSIKDMFAQLNQLKGKLQGSTITTWLKKFTDKFNTLFNNNAEQILQPVLLAIDKEGNVSRVSGNPTAASEFEGEITLEPTSYSAEVFAPCYAKYVGCKDITEDGFNEILYAFDKKLKFTPKAGTTYEIVYEAMDFFGHTFKHTYYIQGK